MTVLVSGGGVPGSPFTSQVEAGPAVAGKSTAAVSRSIISFFPLVSRVQATVTAKDQFGNATGRGGDAVLMSVDGGTAVAAIDNGNGTYSLSVDVGGLPDQATITLNGGQIQGSPFGLN